MDEIDLLTKLGVAARAEPDPAIDVAAMVRRRLHQRVDRHVDRRWALASLCACSIGAVALGVSFWPTRDVEGAAVVAQLADNNESDVLLELVQP